MRSRNWSPTWGLLAVAALVIGACGGDDGEGAAASNADCGDFPNKNVELIIPASPGGGNDTWGRLIAAAMEKTLPGQPTVTPVNEPGAGTLLGISEVYGAEPDGYTIGIAEPGVISTSQLAGTTQVDIEKLRFVGRLTMSAEALVVSSKSDWNTLDDVKAAAAEQPLKMAMAGLAAVQVVSLDAVDLPYTTVNHEGSSEAVLSLVRGDSDFAIFTLASLGNDIRNGDVKPVMIIGEKPESGTPGAEEAGEATTLDEVSGEEGLGVALQQHRMLIAPPETPDCVVTALSDSMMAAFEDPEFLEQVEAAEFEPHPLPAAEAQEIAIGVLESLAPYEELLAAELEGS
jgi:tripartite-type tricarboxylate transporter receptor subunit TctC